MATTHTARPTARRPSRLARRDFFGGLLLAGGGASLLAACGGSAAVTVATTASSAAAATTTSPSARPTTAQNTPVSAAATVASSVVSRAVPTSAATTVPSTGNATQAPVTLTIMSESDFNDGSTPAFWQSYEPVHPGITIDPQPQTCGNCDTKFTTLFAANTPPDLIVTGGNGMIDWGIGGAATALNGRIARSKIIRSDNFIARALDEGSWQGKNYGLYWSGDSRALYWNKDLFRAAGLDPEQPPQNWDAFATAMQKLTRTGSDGSIQRLGYDPTYNSVGAHWWETWFWELGGSYLSADGAGVTIANDKGAGALDFMVKQAQVQGGWDKVSAFFTAASNDAGKAKSTLGWGFGLQKVAMMTEATKLVANLKKVWPTINYGISGIPAASTGTRASVRGGYSWVVPAQTRHQDDAWSYLEWIFAPEQMVANANRLNAVPTTLDALNGGKWLPDAPDVRKVATEVMGYGQRIPCIAPGYIQILPLNATIVPPVLMGTVTAQVQLQTVQTQVQAVLTKALAAAKK